MRPAAWASQILGYLRQSEPTVLGAVLIVVLGVWAFIAVASQVLEGDTQALDERIMHALRDPAKPSRPVGPSWMVQVGQDVTALGGYSVLVFVTGAVIGFLALDRRYGAMWLILAAAGGGTVLGFGLKALFGRERPDAALHLVAAHTASFPSGHAMMSAVVYLTLGALLAGFAQTRTLKLYFLSLAVLLTAFVGASRVYLGVHYPSDVLAGWTVGLVWAVLCWLIARRLQKRGTVESGL